MKEKKFLWEFAYLVATLLLALLFLFSGAKIFEMLRYPSPEAEVVPTKTITRGDNAYFPRMDQTNILVMGIDQFGPVADSESYANRGAADMVLLLTFDEEQKTCSVLHFNRDTMLTMPVLGLGGRQAGTYYGQLALSHTYGSGLEDSAENTRQTISDFLYGLHIDYYIAMNMDAIPILNDAVGGVTVNVVDDFTDVDPTIRLGTQTLMGDQSIHFVRTRKDVGDQKNISRMDRQREYIDGFVAAFREKQDQDTEFIAKAYDEAAPYLVTDCSVNAISGMISRYSDYEITQVRTPEGENVLGEEYMEFYVNEEALDKLILDLFYAPKE